jgi:truncated hemoglobin YjbI
MKDMVESILAQMPPHTRFTDADSAVVTANKDLLLEMGQGLVESFYRTVLAHPATAEIFHSDEMDARAASLADWWRRTCEGPHDSDFFSWQAFVGLVHIKRRVKNPMVIAMWSHILAHISTALAHRMGAAEAGQVMCSLQRLAATVQALIVESYLQSFIDILGESTGMKPVLIDRLVMTKIDSVIGAARTAAA